MPFTTNPGKELNCRECGDLVKNVGHDATAVICWRCTMKSVGGYQHERVEDIKEDLDIKEENITANYNENTKKVEMRFIDFGLSEYLSPSHCTNYKNINYKGTPDFIPPEIVVSLFTYENYKKNKDINYIFQKVQKYYKENDISKLYQSIKESNMLHEFNNTLLDLIKVIYNDIKSNSFMTKYFGSQSNKFGGFLQKGDIYALGIAMYEFLEVFTGFINVKKDIRLHNLLQNMIKLNPDKRFTVIDCLNHPYFK